MKPDALFLRGSPDKIEKWKYREKTRAFMRIYSVGYTPDLRGNP